MINWSGLTHYHFIAEPMRDTTDKLLGVEVDVRFTSDTVYPLHSDFIISAWDSEQKCNFMLEQIRLIAEKHDWFERNSLICTLNLIDEMVLLVTGDPAIRSTLHALQFTTLGLSERFLSNTACLNNLLINSLHGGPNALWLGDLGSGNVGVSPLVYSHFDVMKLDRGFFLEQVEKPTFPVLTKNIREYCDRVVVKGRDDAWLSDVLSNAGIWVMQGGIFPSVAFSGIEVLLPVKIFHRRYQKSSVRGGRLPRLRSCRRKSTQGKWKVYLVVILLYMVSLKY